MKKYLSVFLAVIILVGCCSCSLSSGGDVPDNMKIATASGADFRLYVPTTWNLNTEFGVSGAYYSLDRQSTVSVTKYPRGEADGVDAFYQTELLPELTAVSVSDSVKEAEEPSATTLGTLNAKRYHLTASANGTSLHALYVVGEGSDSFYVFSALICDELYSVLLSSVENILENFKLDEPYEPDEYARKIDASVPCPDGMVLASGNDVAYRFFVPTAWEINRDERIPAATFSADRSNVSVVPYMPETDGMTADDFLALKETALSQTLVSEDRTIGGRNGKVTEYTYPIDGEIYRYLQAVVSYRGMIYCITYTALPTVFESHLTDVNRMIDEFCFR